ncbi:hypothetical protein OG21DRAFT_1101712 [Imleria badia]|nr:hypothetical protein OG21DRAFT_1101712 [Imleria badia]
MSMTHIPHPVYWSVMSVEHANTLLKPNSFFATNPSMDVPGTKGIHSTPLGTGNTGMVQTEQTVRRVAGIEALDFCVSCNVSRTCHHAALPRCY